MQDHIPNKNYLPARIKFLLWAGDLLASLAGKIIKVLPGGDAEVEAAILDWKEAKENIMGLALPSQATKETERKE